MKKNIETFPSSILASGGFHPRVVLDNSGRPVPIALFMSLTGHRVLRQKFDFSKSPEEKEIIRKAKVLYQNGMRNFFGENWRKVSKKQGYHNVPTKL